MSSIDYENLFNKWIASPPSDEKGSYEDPHIVSICSELYSGLKENKLIDENDIIKGMSGYYKVIVQEIPDGKFVFGVEEK